jgi:RNA polymerase sigma-70 factor (ECF subfamily)
VRVFPAAVLPAGVRVADTATPLALAQAEFRAFHARTARSLAAYLRRSLPAEDVEDAVQEAYLRLLRTPHATLPVEERRAYLYRIAANLVNDAWRARRKAPVTDAEPDALPGPASNPATRVDVTRAMGRLRVQEQTMLWLAYVEQASHREIASALSIKEASVRVLLSRARQKLAGALGIRR